MRPVDSDVDPGTRIRQTRSARGVSLRELARRIDVSPGTVSAVEHGRVDITVGRLRSIAAALELPMAHLVADTAVEPEQRDDETRRAGGDPHRGGRLLGGNRQDTASVGREGNDWRTFAGLSLDPVLRAAVEAFVGTGYHAATMRRIAARAGISVPGIYHHYRSKQQLLVTLLQLTMDDLLWRVRAARGAGENETERVALVVEALALFHTYRHDLAFVGASEMRSLQPANRRRIADLRNTVQYLLDTEISCGVTTGVFDAAGAHTAGRAIATMCTSLPQWFHIDGTVTPEAVAAEYARFALAVLGHGHGRHAEPRSDPVTGASD